MLDRNSLPGYAEAHAKERRIRDIAWLPWEVPLCGIKVRQFSPNHFIALRLAGSPFISETPRDPEVEDILIFLWIVSPSYQPGDDEARKAFCLPLLATVQFLPAITAIWEYLTDAFLDVPRGTAGGVDYFCAFGPLVRTACRDFGMTAEGAMDAPFARLYQMDRIAAKAANPRLPLINPLSDGVVTRTLLSPKRAETVTHA